VVFRRIGEYPAVAWMLAGLAQVAREQGQVERASQLTREALRAVRGTGDLQVTAHLAEAAVLVDQARWPEPNAGRVQEHARLLAAAEGLRVQVSLRQRSNWRTALAGAWLRKRSPMLRWSSSARPDQ